MFEELMQKLAEAEKAKVAVSIPFHAASKAMAVDYEPDREKSIQVSIDGEIMLEASSSEDLGFKTRLQELLAEPA